MTVHAERLAVSGRGALSPWTWLAIGLGVSFLVPFAFTDVLEVPRDAYYAIHAMAALTLLGAWQRTQGVAVRAFVLHRWRWGVSLGLAAAAMLALVVTRTEDATSRPDALELAVSILWRGVVYGAADGMLLSVFPILVVYAALEPHRRHGPGRLAVGAAALLASVAFTAAYHVGYSDFRGEKLRSPVAGDAIWSAPTLLTASPLGAPIAHVGLHVAAVVHSYDTDLFLPPHGTGAPAAELQGTLDGLVDDFDVTGASAAVLTDDWTWMGTAGYADLAAREPTTVDDNFRIASLTKTYTAAVVLSLTEAGRLRLSDTLDRWLPGIHPRASEITVRQLLAHKSGIYDSMNAAVSALLTDAEAFLASLPPTLAGRVRTVAADFRRDPTTPVDPEL